MLKYNKGEWSELYVVYSVLVSGKIAILGSDLNQSSKFIRVLGLFLEDSKGSHIFSIDNGVNKNNGNTISLSSEVREGLLSDIIDGEGRSFESRYGNEALKDLDIEDFKSNSFEKADLDILGILPNENIERRFGFSVKSNIGSLPTLINASQSTNFIYKIEGINDCDVERINSINTKSKILDRICAILDSGGVISYDSMHCDTFEENLRMIDSDMPNIMAMLILSHFRFSGVSDMSRVIRESLELLPNFSKEEIEKKLKDLLLNICLGMVPTRKWDGEMINGGCVFVDKRGSIGCFTLNDMTAFRDYLFKHTKFDTGSTTRHKFGEIYEDNSNFYIKLNLDVRMY